MVRVNWSSARCLLAAASLCSLLVLDGPASAMPIFIPGSEATAAASSVNNDAGEITNQNAVAASAVREVDNPDLARGEARATTAGALGSFSQAEAAGGDRAPTQASASAKWSANFTTSGNNPNAAIDIDFDFNVDGLLSYMNNNSGASTNDIAAGVTVTLLALNNSGTAPLFNGTARLATVDNDQAPNLSLSGDWGDLDRRDDFVFSDPCSRFTCSVEVNTDLTLTDAVFVDFSEVFAITLELSTDAFVFAGFETGALADFLNTAEVLLSTSTPGVDVEFVPSAPPTAVPTPSALWLFSLGLVGLIAFQTRENRGRAVT